MTNTEDRSPSRSHASKSRYRDLEFPAGTPRLVRPREAAQILAISDRKLWEITSPRGPIPCVRMDKAVRYDIEDLRAWVDKQKSRQRR